ncbi:MAG: biopolymer transporter ExbD [bacterium]|nr:biopolymer transporter ExbD [bacterium]
MAGYTPSSTSKWGKRSLDAPVNLVPYIDLMITMITFLMMTAVWSQMASLQVQNESSSTKTLTEKPPSAITVILTTKGLIVSEESGTKTTYNNLNGRYNVDSLKNKLMAFKNADDKRVQINIQAEDGVSYDTIIEVIDLGTGLGLTAVTLTTANG